MNEFTTKDFYLSGFLVYEGFIMLKNERVHGFTLFVFLDSPELQKSVSRYYKSQSSVDPAAYGQTLRQLKGVIHNSVSTQIEVTKNESIFSQTKKPQMILRLLFAPQTELN